MRKRQNKSEVHHCAAVKSANCTFLLPGQTQDDSSEPPAKKLQPSVVLEEFSTKEPELMGVDVIMGMDVVKYMSSAGSKDKSTTGAKTIADAKFGEMHPETDAELEACSGLALRRIQEAEKIVHGKFFQVKPQ